MIGSVALPTLAGCCKGVTCKLGCANETTGGLERIDLPEVVSGRDKGAEEVEEEGSGVEAVGTGGAAAGAGGKRSEACRWSSSFMMACWS